MKLLLFALFAVVHLWSISQNNPPTVELKINGEIIPLNFSKEGSAQNYSVFNSEMEQQKIHYSNLSSIRLVETDEYGNPYSYIDSVSVFSVSKRYQEILCKNISITLSINGEFVNHLTYSYELLSESLRIPNNRIQNDIDSVGTFFCELSDGIEKPKILLYGIEHTDEKGNMITFNMGYVVFELRE